MRKRYILFILLPFFSTIISAQQKIHGTVEDDETGEPVSYASVTPLKGEIIVTDSSGKFSMLIRKQPKANDSVSITAVGYFPKKISVKELLTSNKIKLKQQQKELDQVKIYASLKGDMHQFGYYRDFRFDTLTWIRKVDSVKYKTNDRYRWNMRYKKATKDVKKSERMSKGAGEIGYIFEMPTKKFQVGQVQVKINHNYDTCWLKLHLRNVGASGLGLPEDDLLKKDVVLPVTLKYGLVEFDLNWEPISIPNNQVYVGFELQRCECKSSDAPSFFFMGNETGINFYRENDKATWKRGVDYTIYVRMMTK